MPLPTTELTIEFGAIAPAAADDVAVAFTVRNEATGESWAGGQFRSPLGDADLAELAWYLEEYAQWPFGPFHDRAHGIEARLEGFGRALFKSLFDEAAPARIYEHFLNTQPRCAR